MSAHVQTCESLSLLNTCVQVQHLSRTLCCVSWQPWDDDERSSGLTQCFYSWIVLHLGMGSVYENIQPEFVFIIQTDTTDSIDLHTQLLTEPHW